MKISAEEIIAKDLQPGDLFSTAGPKYWNQIDARYSIGEKVYIRTNTPAKIADDPNEKVFKITIIKDEKKYQ